MSSRPQRSGEPGSRATGRKLGFAGIGVGERKGDADCGARRRGAVEAHDRHGNFVDRYGEGESFGLQSLLTGKPVIASFWH